MLSSQKRSPTVSVIESLESRQMFSTAPAPLPSPVPFGHYTLVMQSNPSDPKPFTETFQVDIKRRKGAAFGGFIYDHPRHEVRGAELPDGYVHLREQYKHWSSLMLLRYDSTTGTYQGEFFYNPGFADAPGHVGHIIGLAMMTKNT